MRGSRPPPPPPPGQDAGHVCTFTCQAPSQAQLALPPAPPVRLLPYIMPPLAPASLPGSPFYPRSRSPSTPTCTQPRPSISAALPPRRGTCTGLAREALRVRVRQRTILPLTLSSRPPCRATPSLARAHAARPSRPAFVHATRHRRPLLARRTTRAPALNLTLNHLHPDPPRRRTLARSGLHT